LSFFCLFYLRVKWFYRKILGGAIQIIIHPVNKKPASYNNKYENFKKVYCKCKKLILYSKYLNNADY